jgi:RHS repeat-associated protein
MNKPQAVAIGQPSQFFVNTKNASACYSLPIEVPAAIRGLSPDFTLYYSSLGGQGGNNVASAGWSLGGFLALSNSGSQYIDQNGIPVFVEFLQKGSVLHEDREGNRFEFTPNALHDSYLLCKMQDGYGNQVHFKYDPEEKLREITYGADPSTPAKVLFSYEKVSGKLIQITCLVGIQQVRRTLLNYHNGLLSDITVQARKVGGINWSEKPKISFSYEDDLHKFDRQLTEIHEPFGLITNITYQPESSVVSTYAQSVSGLLGKVQTTNWRVNAETIKTASKYDPYFEKISLICAQTRRGQYWRNGQYGNAQILVLEQGSFTELKDKGQFFIEQKTNEYQWHKGTESYLKNRVVRTTYGAAGKALPSVSCDYEYDQDGMIIRQSDDRLLVLRQYIGASKTSRARFLKDAQLFDLSKGESLSAKNLLRHDIFSHEFCPDKSCLLRIEHSLWVTEDAYSQPEIKLFDQQGLTLQHQMPNGLVSRFKYDAQGFCCSEICRTADGDILSENLMQVDGFSGKIIRKSTANGLVSSIEFGAFGDVICEKGLNPNAADLPTTEDQLEVLSRHASWFDDQLGVQVDLNCRPATDVQKYHFNFSFRDALGREVATVQQMGKRKWQVVITRHKDVETVDSYCEPFVISGSYEDFASSLAKIRKKELKWHCPLIDAFGRDRGFVYPDGSRAVQHYDVTSAGALEITTHLCDAKGRGGAGNKELHYPDGSISRINQGDAKESLYQHDGLGQLISVNGPDGTEQTYTWNGMGRCSRSYSAQTGVVSCEFGQDLTLRRRQDAAGVTEYVYNAQGRQVAITTQLTGEKKQSFKTEYRTDQSNCVIITNTHPSGIKDQTRYSAAGYAISRQWDLGPDWQERLEYAYDTLGNQCATTYPDGRIVNLKIDGSGHVYDYQDGQKGTSLLSFAGNGDGNGPKEIHFANGMSEYREFGSNGQLIKFKVCDGATSGSKTHFSQRLEHTPGYLGRVAFQQDQQGQVGLLKKQYSYDPAGRLAAVQEAQGKTLESFGLGAGDGYDAPLQASGQEMGPVSRYKADNRGGIVQTISGSDKYDLQYDATGYLSEAKRKSGEIAHTSRYLYWADGQRLLRTGSDGITRFYIDDDFEVSCNGQGDISRTITLRSPYGVAAEWTETEKHRNSKRTSFADHLRPPTDHLAARLKPDGILFFHLDHQGNSVLISNTQKQVVGRLSFNSHGEIKAGSPVNDLDCDVIYAGMRYEAEAGLYYAGVRYFDPRLKLFLTPDPAKASTDLHAYPADPINFYDDGGLCGRPNCLRCDPANTGRAMTLTGAGFFTALSSVALYMAWDILAFGFEPDRALRWALAIGIWFTQLVVFPGLFNSCNANRRILCGSDRLQPIGQPEIPRVSSFLIRVMISSAIGVVWLGPLLSFIGGPNCAPWRMFNCDPAFYHQSMVRGAAASAVAGTMSGLAREFFGRFQCSGNSLSFQYITSLLGLWTGFMSWQCADFALLYGVYGQPAGQIFDGKLAFASGQLALGLFMAQPNPIWGILPTCFGNRLPRVIAACFAPRARYLVPHPFAGAYIPILPGGAHPVPGLAPAEEGEGPQIEVLEMDEPMAEEHHVLDIEEVESGLEHVPYGASGSEQSDPETPRISIDTEEEDEKRDE